MDKFERDFWVQNGDYYFSSREMMRRSRPQANWDLDAWIQHDPHYSDPQFDRGQTKTVFGQKEKDIEYVYSDRMWQWDWDKAKDAAAAAGGKVGAPNTARWHQVFLAEYYGKEVELRHMIVGVNTSNGYSYRAYGFRFKEGG